MAYQNFIPELWAEKIQRENEKMLVLAKLCNRQWEGELKKKGDTVHILGIGAPTIGDYDGTSINPPETLADTSIPLVIDKAKYFNVMVDDVDRRQSAGDVMEFILAEASEALSVQEDSDIAEAIFGGLLSENKVPAEDVAASGAASARRLLQQAKTKLFKNGVGKNTDIVAVVSPDFLERIEIEVENLETDNDRTAAAGFAGKTSGISIYVSNNLYTVTEEETTKEMIYVMTRRAVAHASQINEVKAYAPEDLFADAVKGLNTYGTKVVRPKEVVCLMVESYA